MTWLRRSPGRIDLTRSRNKEAFLHTVGSTNGDYGFDAPGTTEFRATRIGNAQNSRFVWHVPSDFLSLTAVTLTMIPDATENLDFNIDASWGAVGEQGDNETDNNDNNTPAVTADTITEFDVLAVLSGMSTIVANDYLTVEMRGNQDYHFVVGLTIRYKAT
jgi:hypothetical protein